MLARSRALFAAPLPRERERRTPTPRSHPRWPSACAWAAPSPPGRPWRAARAPSPVRSGEGSKKAGETGPAWHLQSSAPQAAALRQIATLDVYGPHQAAQRASSCPVAVRGAPR